MLNTVTFSVITRGKGNVTRLIPLPGTHTNKRICYTSILSFFRSKRTCGSARDSFPYNLRKISKDISDRTAFPEPGSAGGMGVCELFRVGNRVQAPLKNSSHGEKRLF